MAVKEYFVKNIYMPDCFIYHREMFGCANRKWVAMNSRIFTLEDITVLVKPLAEKYNVKEVYLFGSYARGEANGDSVK